VQASCPKLHADTTVFNRFQKSHFTPLGQDTSIGCVIWLDI
jgi:hypothetical protein